MAPGQGRASTALRVDLLWGELQTRRGRRAQHWRRVARVAQRARVRSGAWGSELLVGDGS